MRISCKLIDVYGVEDDRDFPITVFDMTTMCKTSGSSLAGERTKFL